jgi:hypothetical protein
MIDLAEQYTSSEDMNKNTNASVGIFPIQNVSTKELANYTCDYLRKVSSTQSKSCWIITLNLENAFFFKKK